MQEIRDGVRVEVVGKTETWIAHLKMFDKERKAIDAPNGVFREETDAEVAKRLGFSVQGREITIPVGSLATIRHMTFFNRYMPRPVPEWLKFHRDNPKYDEWLEAYYAREGDTAWLEVGMYTSDLPDDIPDDWYRKFSIWVLEFDDFPIDCNYNQYVCGFGVAGWPDYLEEVSVPGN